MRRRLAVPFAAAGLALLLGGCTLSGGQSDPSGSPAAGGSSTTDPTSTPTASETPSGPTPEELSAELLEQAAAAPPAPIGSQTVQVDAIGGSATVPVTIDVLAVQRTRDATKVTMQMSSPEVVEGLRNTALSAVGLENTTFFDRFALQDTPNGVNYLALSWLRPDLDEEDPAGPPNSCICPYRGAALVLSPEPIVMDALFGPLPEDVGTVSFVGPDEVLIPDLPVAPFTG
ncbi:hypothetical protein [Aquipuribacter sp. MA13-6]|uniref:hypothetical protein n=1 Tax=unclassified Aquipuribacter TaxID=2635084 RepID=UPI003EEDF1EE